MKKLVEEVLIPKYTKFNNEHWMGWRENKLWTLEIDDLYRTNLPAMQKLYKFYFIAKKVNKMMLEDAIQLVTMECRLDMLPDVISQCWGLSKMTCYNDLTMRKAHYEGAFVEFLEFFARLAE